MNNNSVSPFLGISLDEDNDTITGTRTYIWKNVNFPETGRYKIYFQSDDQADLFIDGNLTKKSRGFRGDPEETYAEITTGNYEVKVVCNNLNFAGRNRFRNNPTGFAVRILKDITVRGEGQSWRNNPVGISAILVPPPCPKVITGRGRVEDIIVRQPGNGFIVPPGEGFPTIVTVKDVDIISPGINYSTDDVALINGIPVPIIVDNFGRIQSIDPGAGGPIPVTRYPSLTVPSRTGLGSEVILLWKRQLFLRMYLMKIKSSKLLIWLDSNKLVTSMENHIMDLFSPKMDNCLLEFMRQSENSFQFMPLYKRALMLELQLDLLQSLDRAQMSLAMILDLTSQELLKILSR